LTNKLVVNVPAFNKEAIKPDMFIISREKATDKIMKGVIVKVDDSQIQYLATAGGGTIRTVSLDAVLNGRAIINVGHTIALNETDNAVTSIIKSASTGVSVGFSALNISLQRNEHTDGILFNEVVVDGIKYVRPASIQFTPHTNTTISTDIVRGGKI